jgi:hypothetical protein
VDRTNPVSRADKSAGLFECNLLIVSLIDPILLPLASYFCCDHVSAVGKCFHHLVA